MDVFLKYYYLTFPDEMPKPKGEDSSATSAAAKKKQHTGADGEPEADEVIIAAASLGRGSYAFAVRRDATACPGRCARWLHRRRQPRSLTCT